MKTDVEQFQERVAKLGPEDLDEALTLSIRLLMSIARDYGTEGERAKRLLRIAAEMIDVYY